MLTDTITAFKRQENYACVLFTHRVIETGEFDIYEKIYQGSVNDKFLTLAKELEPDCTQQDAYDKQYEIWEDHEQVMRPTDEGYTHVCTVVLYCDAATVGDEAATVDDVVDWGSVDLVGMFTVHTDYGEAVNAYVAYGSELVVSSTHRHVGNGKRVVNYAEDITMTSAEMLAVYHYVHAEEGNTASINTFKSCGYTRLDENDIRIRWETGRKHSERWPHLPSSVLSKFTNHDAWVICLFKLSNLPYYF